MKKYGPLLTLAFFLVLPAASFGQETGGQETGGYDSDATSYDSGTGGASQPEMAPIAYPPEMAEPVPVYTSDPNAPAPASTETDSTQDSSAAQAPAPVVNQTIIQQQTIINNGGGTLYPHHGFPPHDQGIGDQTDTATSTVKAAPNNKAVNSEAASVIETNRERINDIARKRQEELNALQGRDSSSSTDDQ